MTGKGDHDALAIGAYQREPGRWGSVLFVLIMVLVLVLSLVSPLF